MPKLTFLESGVTVEVWDGTTVLEAAMEHGVTLYHTCGGNASCSTCRVLVRSGEGNLSAVEGPEAEVLDAFDLKPPHRLGCQAEIHGDVTVEVPARAKEPRPNKTPPVPE
ncbi:MAG TPA: 2Fe-2S iron-sulfur cluster-binding protein [Candidatus Eisenbacteria bacterium]|nr:2Fe-2S iron-sulfur cluster-binding protein [Candidatus Eisenbacteria bacterium]